MTVQQNLDPTRAHPYRFTVSEFIDLHERGLFDDFSKSELLDGEIVCMNAQWSLHARVKTGLAAELLFKLRELGSPLRPQNEASVHLSDRSMPEPDIVVTDYRGREAVPLQSVAMLVEVSDSTLDIDLGRKAKLYAEAGIAEYWVVDVNAGVIFVHTQPSAKGYAQRVEQPLGAPIASRTIAGLVAPTDELLD